MICHVSSHQWRVTLLGMASLLLFALPAWAQPPNDACTNAINIPIANGGFAIDTFESDSVDLTNATKALTEEFHPTHNSGTDKKSVWYTFTLPTTRGVNLALDQNGTDIAQNGAGFSVYYSNNCRPSLDAIEPAKLTPIDKFGSTFNPCLLPGTYLVQVSARSDADGYIHMDLTTSRSTVLDSYDQQSEAQDFGQVSQEAPDSGLATYDVGCLSTEQSESACGAVSSEFTQSSWHVFETDDKVDYLRYAWKARDLSTTDTFSYGFRLYEGDAINNPGSLSEVVSCEKIEQVGDVEVFKDFTCSLLNPNTHYSVQLFYHHDSTATIETRLSETGSQTAKGPDPNNVPASKQMGVVSGSEGGTWYSVEDFFSCESRMSLYSCATGIPASDTVWVGSTPYQLNNWSTFTISEDKNVRVEAPVSGCGKAYVRIYQGDITSAGACGASPLTLHDEFQGQKDLNCLPGAGTQTYSVQVLGRAGSGELPNCGSSNSQLGRSVALKLKVQDVKSFSDFSLSGTSLANGNPKVDSINGFSGALQPLPDGVEISAESDVIGCNKTVLPKDADRCNNSKVDRAMYRIFHVDQQGILTIDDGNWSQIGNRYKLYRGNAQTEANSQGLFQYPEEIENLSDRAGCQSTFRSFRVCANPGDYTLVTYGDSTQIGTGDQPSVKFDLVTTQFDDPTNPDDLGDITSSGGSGTQDFFSCTDNPQTIDGAAPCNGATKLIYRQFFLNSATAIKISTQGRGRSRLFEGKVSDVGITGLTQYTDTENGNWGCFNNRSASVCDPLPSGWYTVVSYGRGNTYASPEYSSGRGEDIGRSNNISISIIPPPSSPQYNRPGSASDEGTLTWGDYSGPSGNGTRETPINARSYEFATENFNCQDDLPFSSHPITPCNATATFNRAAYYVFQTNQVAQLLIDDVPSSMEMNLFAGDVRSTDLSSATPIQPCIEEDNDAVQICNLQPNTYSLIIFANDGHIGQSISPEITLDSVGTSKFNYAQNAYDFGEIPGDNVRYFGNLSDSQGPLGREPSNDFFFCTTNHHYVPDDDQVGPGSPSCHTGGFPQSSQPSVPDNVPANYPIHDGPNSHPNPMRGLWYTFTVEGPGKVEVSVINQTPGKQTQYPWAIYKAPDLSTDDSTLAQGLTFVENSYSPFWCSNYETRSFERSPCVAPTTDRYYVVVFNREDMMPNSQVEVGVRFDGVPANPTQYDHYSTAHDIGGDLSTGTHQGDTAYFACASSDPGDPGSCTPRSLWYKFQSSRSGLVRINYELHSTGLSQTLYDQDEIRLYRELVPGDSTSLQQVSLDKVTQSGTNWGEACLEPNRQYYLLMTGCSYTLENGVPQVQITEEDGDFASTAVPMTINSDTDTTDASVSIDCHTIGTDLDEDTVANEPIGCMFEPKGHKSTWFRVDISTSEKADLSFRLSENTDALPSEIRYRVLFGNVGALTTGPCNTDALTEFTLACMQSGSYFVQVMSPEDAKGTLSMEATTSPVTDTACVPINPNKPIANFELENACAGTPVTFENHSTAIDSVDYEWDFDDGGATSTDFEPTHTFSSPGTYDIKLVVTSTVNGEKDSLTQPLEIYPQPSANITRDPPQDGETVTTGTSIQFHGNISNTISAPATVISWDFDDAAGTTSSSEDPSITYSVDDLGTRVVELTVRNGTCTIVEKDTFVVGFEPIFGGGPYDGSGQKFQATSCTEPTLDTIFGGGPFDGASRDLVASACSEPPLDTIFGGGPFDGSSEKFTAVACTEPTLDTIFGGGPYDGSSRDLEAVACVEPSLDSIFGGGPFDGSSDDFEATACAEPTLADVFGGGHFDGHDYANAGLSITATSGSDTLCPGSSVTLQANASGTVDSYLWSDGGETTQSVTFTPTKDTTVSVRVEMSDCSPAFRYETFFIHVYEPIADAGPDTAACSGDNVVLGRPAVPGYSYSWSPTTGLSDPNIAQPTANPSSTTTYELTVTPSSGPCTGLSETDQMTFNVPDPSNVDAGPDQAICQSGSVTLGQAAEPGYTYEWTPAIFLSDSSVAAPTFTAGVTTTYTLHAYVEGSSNCSEVFDTVKVFVDEPPQPDAGADKLYCGTPVTIGTPGRPDKFSYSWSPTTGLSDPTVPQPEASPSSATGYELTVTPLGGSGGACASAIDSVNVQTTGSGTPAAGSDQIICGSGSVTLGSSAVSGYNYNWIPTEGLNDSSLAQPTASPSATTTYTMEAIAPNCDTVVEKVEVKVVPQPDTAAGSDVTLCVGDSVQLGPAPESGYTYSWSPSSGLDNSSIAQPMASPTSTTTYALTVEDVGGNCSWSDDVQVTVEPLPSVDGGSDETLCPGNTTTLNASGANTYRWLDTAGNVLGNTSSLTVSDSGLFIVEGTSSAGCIAFDTVEIDLFQNTALHYRSRQNGQWGELTTWQVSTNLSTWTDAENFGSCGGADVPSHRSLTITVRDSVHYESTIGIGVDELTVQSGATLFVSDGVDFRLVDSSSSPTTADFQNNGRFNIEGSFTTVGDGLLVNDFNSTVAYTNTNTQSLWAGSYGILELSGNGDPATEPKLLSSTGTRVENQLRFQGASLKLNNLPLTLSSSASVANAGYGEGFLITNASGFLEKEGLGSGGFLFPVGPSAGSYNPLDVSNSGTPDAINVRVSEPFAFETAFPNDELSQSCAVDRTWFLDEATSGGSQLDITAYYEEAHQFNTSLSPSTADLAAFDGSAGWQMLGFSAPPAGSGTMSDPYRVSGTGISELDPLSVGLQLGGDHYRSIQAGKWGELSTWEVSNSASGPWTAAENVVSSCGNVPIPSSLSETIEVRHAVTFDKALSNGVDELTISSAGHLKLPDTVAFNLKNGPGTDLANQGRIDIGGEFNRESGALWTNSDASTVLYNGPGDQNMHAVTFGNLWLDAQLDSAEARKVLTANGARVNTELRFLNARLDLADYDLTLDENATISGAGQASGYMVATAAGHCAWEYAAGTNRSHTFPLGGSLYSPVKVTFDEVSSAGTLLGQVQEVIHPTRTEAIQRFWTLTEGSLTFNGSYDATFTYNQQDLPQIPANNTEEQSMVEVGGAYSPAYSVPDNWRLSPVHISNALDVTVNQATIRNDAFSDFTLMPESAMPLPIRMLPLKARWSGKDALLEWKVLSESQNEGFEIQRSFRLNSFETVDFVQGRGTAQQTETYSYRDTGAKAATPNMVYYRLRQVDFDGSQNFSNVVALVKGDKQADGQPAELVLYPNPIPRGQHLQVLFQSPEEQTFSVRITDMVGRTIRSKNIHTQEGSNRLRLSTQELSAGQYILSIGAQGKPPQRARFIVE